MSNSSQNAKIPSFPAFPDLPPEGKSDMVLESDLKESDIRTAAKEGRLSLRAADLAPKIIEELAKKFGPDTIVNQIAECMGATKTIAISGRPFETPDYKTRLDTLKLLLQYQIGMPVARSEVVTHNVDTMQSLESKMKGSPALRRAIGKMLDRSKVEQGEVVETQMEDISEEEEEEAERVLKSIKPEEEEETPVQREVRVRTMGDALRVKGTLDPVEKFSR